MFTVICGKQYFFMTSTKNLFRYDISLSANVTSYKILSCLYQQYYRVFLFLTLHIKVGRFFICIANTFLIISIVNKGRARAPRAIVTTTWWEILLLLSIRAGLAAPAPFFFHEHISKFSKYRIKTETFQIFQKLQRLSGNLLVPWICSGAISSPRQYRLVDSLLLLLRELWLSHQQESNKPNCLYEKLPFLCIT